MNQNFKKLKIFTASICGINYFVMKLFLFLTILCTVNGTIRNRRIRAERHRRENICKYTHMMYPDSCPILGIEYNIHIYDNKTFYLKDYYKTNCNLFIYDPNFITALIFMDIVSSLFYVIIVLRFTWNIVNNKPFYF